MCFFKVKLFFARTLDIVWMVVAYRSDNFIVGLSNSYPASRLSALWNYVVNTQGVCPMEAESVYSVRTSVNEDFTSSMSLYKVMFCLTWLNLN